MQNNNILLTKDVLNNSKHMINLSQLLITFRLYLQLE